ncbi:hypothetical protein NESM_000628900 [Novymonas esmeraldas]|uniref:Uncharacterized protein n=1 Tax=Novymonas esmeraldas TaxID=1808958 RepID=A0AAW0ERT3_9TRYP
MDGEVQRCPASHITLPLLVTTARAHTSGSVVGAPSAWSSHSAATVCLTCITERLRRATSPLQSVADGVRRDAVSVMEALVCHCPSSDEGEQALRVWSHSWLAFDDDTQTGAAAARSRASALSDVLVALYTYVVRHGSSSGAATAVAVVAAAAVTGTVATARAPRGTCADRDPSRGGDDTHWEVLVDLVQLLFSCWEMVLQQRRPQQQTITAPPRQDAASVYSTHPTAAAAASLPPTLLGDTYDAVREEDEKICEHPSRAAESVTPATAARLHDMARHFVEELLSVAEDDAAAVVVNPISHALRSPAAVAMLLRLLRASPLLRRVVQSSLPLARTLAGVLLPRLVALHRRLPPRPPLSGHAAASVVGVDTSSLCRSAVSALMSVLHFLWSDAEARWLSAVAAELSCPAPYSLPSSGVPTTSTLAARVDGTPLLTTLLLVLQMCGAAPLSPLRLSTLRLLHQLCLSPLTRRALFCTPRRGESAWSDTAASRDARRQPRAADVARVLLPLLLSSDGEEEVVQLTCGVLLRALLHEAQFVPTSTCAADAFNESVTAVATGADTSAVVAVVGLADDVRDYTTQALYTCTSATGPPLVALLNQTASIAAAARELLQCAAVTAGGVDAAARRGRQSLESLLEEEEEEESHDQRRPDWRVLFHVAEVDITLVEPLLRGRTLHDALARCAGGAALFDWDEVARSIASLAAVRDGAHAPLSLFGLLRCLDAVAAGLQGEVHVLWSSRVCELMRELLERVGELVGPTSSTISDAAAAAATFAALLRSGADQRRCDDHDHDHDVPSGAPAGWLLGQVVDAPTAHLLTRVVAVYLPAAEELLLPLSVQLLLRAVQTRALAAAHCADPLTPATATSAVEESRCLLRITALLLQTQPVVRAVGAAAPRGLSHRRRSLAALHRRNSIDVTPSVSPSSVSQQRGTASQLLDVLLGLYPNAPELAEARADLLHALAHHSRPAAAAAAWRAAPSPALSAVGVSIAGAASLAEAVLALHGGLQPHLLLRLQTLGCTPCVRREDLLCMLDARCRALHEELNGAASTASSSPCGEGVSDVDGDVDDGVSRLVRVLEELLVLCVVEASWRREAAADSPVVPLQSGPHDVASMRLPGLTPAHVRALAARVEGSAALRVHLRECLVGLHTEHGVDVCGFLEHLRTDGDATALLRLPPEAPAHALTAALFAVALTSIVTHTDAAEVDVSTASATADHVRLLRARQVLWAMESAASGTAVSPSVSLFLRILFRMAQTTPSPATAAAVRGLRFVYRQLAQQLHGCTAATPARDGDSDSDGEVGGGAPWHNRRCIAVATSILRDHVVPLLLLCRAAPPRQDGGAQHGVFLMSGPAVEYAETILQLISIALWPLASTTCAALDAVVADYVVGCIHHLLGLTPSELADPGGAARRLLCPLLQVVYLVLMRAHRGSILRHHGASVVLFAARAQAAAAERWSTAATDSSGVSCGALAEADVGDSCDVSVMAAVVLTVVAQAEVGPWRRWPSWCATCPLPGGADVQPAAGCIPASPGLKPWYERIPVLALHRLMCSATGTAAEQRPTRERWRRRVLLMTLSGVEYVLSHERQPERPRGVSPDTAANTSHEESHAAAMAMDWCAELLFATGRDGADTDGWRDGSGALVAARLLHRLFHMYSALAAHSACCVLVSLQYAHVSGSAGVLLRCHPPAVAGWLMAALLHLLTSAAPPHCRVSHGSLEHNVAHFFEEQMVGEWCTAMALRAHARRTAAARTGSAARDAPASVTSADGGGGDGDWAAVSSPSPQLSCSIRVLASACQHVEVLCADPREDTTVRPKFCSLRLHSARNAAAAAAATAASGTAGAAWAWSEYTHIYAVPSTAAGAPPLLLLFRVSAHP